MTTPRSTFNNLSADLLPIVSTSILPSSGDSVTITTTSSGASNSLSNQIAVAVAHALQHSLPTFVVRNVQRATPLQFPPPPPPPPPPPTVSSAVSSSSMVAASLLASASGMLRVPSFLSTFTAVPTITGSCSVCLAQSIAAPIIALNISSLSLGSNSLAPFCDKPFVVGPGRVPIPAKLVKKLPVASLWNELTCCLPISELSHSHFWMASHWSPKASVV